MKIFLFKIFLFLFSLAIVKTLNLTSVPYSDYNTPSSLMNYLLNHKTFYVSNYSIFFQFAFYIPIEESKIILENMTSLYETLGLYGIILILDKNSNITNKTVYSDELLDLVEKEFNYKNESTYIIILEYDPGEYGEEWENNLYISVGGKKAENYLNETSRNELINKWEKTLKIYNYDNFSKFYGDVISKIFLTMNEKNKNVGVSDSTFKAKHESDSTIIEMFIIVILIFVIYAIFHKRKDDDHNYNFIGRLNARSPLFLNTNLSN